jgi:hypothetical protein
MHGAGPFWNDARIRAEDLGNQLATIYVEAKKQLPRDQVLVSYSPEGSEDFKITVTLAEREVGFGDSAYQLDCGASSRRPMCLLARALPMGQLTALADQLARGSGEEAGLEVILVGKADSAWRTEAKPRTYQGECGVHDCSIEQQMFELKQGLIVDSNEKLACLRALCMLAESGIGDHASKLRLQLRGMVAGTGSEPQKRRADISLRLPRVGSHAQAGYASRLWNAFHAAVTNG